jgi:hypothetical protein
VGNVALTHHSGHLHHLGTAWIGFLRPVRPAACIRLGTDRTVSIAASRCEGSHINGRAGDALVWQGTRRHGGYRVETEALS